MFGRKFQLLKKKIFKVDTDSEEKKKKCDKLEDSDNDRQSFKKIINSGNLLSSQSFSFGRQDNSEISRLSQNLSQTTPVDSENNCKRISPQIFRVFNDEFEIPPHHEDINFQTNNYFYLAQSLSKFKLAFQNNEKEIKEISNQRVFQNEKKLTEYLNRKLKVFNSDRFFIYPSDKIDSHYYRKKIRNITNKFTTVSVYYDMSNNSENMDKYRPEHLKVEHAIQWEIINYSMQMKLQKLYERNENLNKEIEKFQIELENLTKEESELLINKKLIAQSLNYGEIRRKNLTEYIHNIKGNIRVYCRVKPSIKESIIKYPELSLNIDQKELISLEVSNPKTNEQSLFNFDRVFTEVSTQEEVFSEVKPFIQSALDGENVCIFAYGSTGSGKTHTMQGYYHSKPEDTDIITPDSGILPRCAQFIFEEASRLNLLGMKIKVSFSATEIYNENLYDLLDKSTSSNGNNKRASSNNRQSLTVFVAGNDIQIKNLTWVGINNNQDILKYTKEASDCRRSDSTQFNSCSSRSHAIFQIKIENQKDNGTVTTSLINVIDLAGSERSSLQSLNGKNKNEVDLVKKIQNEANFINKSLTTLGRIISLIGDKKANKIAIPYRESKLTMVLQNSLRSNSKTAMIVTVCSDANTLNMTKDSLKFATNTMLSC